MVPVSHTSISGSSTARSGPCIPPSHQTTACFHRGLLSWGKGEGDDLEDMARCLALHVLQLPCWHFPCVQNKNVNKEQVIKPARQWKWQELLETRGPGGFSQMQPVPAVPGLWAVGSGLAAPALAPRPRPRPVPLFSTMRRTHLGLPSPTRH